MNTKPDAPAQARAVDDPMPPPPFNQAKSAPDAARFTTTQTNRDPETGKLVTGKEGE